MSINRPRILITQPIDPAAIEGFKEYGDVTLAFDASRAEFLEMVEDYDALIVRVKFQIDKEVIDRGRNLKVIAMNGIGLNHIDVNYAKEKGIAVLNVPDASNDSVAELTIGLMLALARNIWSAYSQVKGGVWNQNANIGSELNGKTLGIIALGKIGSRVAKIAQALGMKVITFDPFITQEAAEAMNVKKVELDELLAASDVITIHAPLTKDTKHMLNKETFARMKKGVYLVNAGRGGIIDEDALYDALKSGHIGGFAADVLTVEPPGIHKIFEFPNVVVTPHIGGTTYEAQGRIGKKLVEDIKKIFID